MSCTCTPSGAIAAKSLGAVITTAGTSNGRREPSRAHS
jgi:hypothetical protein